MRRLAAFVLAIVAAAAVPRPAVGQGFTTFRFQVDNDYFDFWLPSVKRPDNEYTHGVFVRALIPLGPKWARAGRAECVRVRPLASNTGPCAQGFISITQAIYTPVRDSAVPIPGQRPYAGILFAEIGRDIMSPRSSSALGFRLGITGDASLAHASQWGFHSLTGQSKPAGWGYQLAAEPIVGLSYTRRFLATPVAPTPSSLVALIASGTANATTIQGGISAGLELRAGYKLSHPWLPAADPERRRHRAYVILGIAEQWVAWNRLLSGNSATTKGLVSGRPFVLTSVWGLGAGVGSYTLEYRATTTAREYETSPHLHRWGTLALIHGLP